MLDLNLPAFKNNRYKAHDHFHGNSPHGKIPTKKEPIRMLGFTSTNCRIIINNIIWRLGGLPYHITMYC